MTVLAPVGDLRAEMLAYAFMLYCRHLCGNRVKLFITGEKPESRVGFPWRPNYCRLCRHFNEKTVAVYKAGGLWDEI